MRLIFDLETTGLSPQRDQILEIGAIALEDDTDLVRARFSSTIRLTRLMGEIAPVVQTMHTENGLFASCATSQMTEEDADIDLAIWIDSLCGDDKRVQLAGYSIHFDRAFVQHRMRRTAQRLHHTMVDISTLSRALSEWGIDTGKPDEMPHRALPDCELELAHYLRIKHKILELACRG